MRRSTLPDEEENTIWAGGGIELAAGRRRDIVATECLLALSRWSVAIAHSLKLASCLANVRGAKTVNSQLYRSSRCGVPEGSSSLSTPSPGH